MIQSILLSTDGSAPAEHVAEFAASLAAQCRAKVMVLHAYNPVPGFLGEPIYSQALQNTLREAESLVANVAKRLRDIGVTDVITDVVAGSAADVILDVAQTRKPDLIVVGARGLSTWQGIILGSVSMAVAHRAECPVLVVK